MEPLYLGIGLAVLGMLLLWFLGDTDMHDERGCMFEQPEFDMKKFLEFLRSMNKYEK